jgi:hypothetical protein
MTSARTVDLERAIMTLQIVLGGGRLASVDDLSEALAVVGHTTEAIFAALTQLGRGDIAAAYVRELADAVARAAPSGTRI